MRNKQIIGCFLTLIFIISGCASNAPLPTNSISTLITSDPLNAEIYWGAVEGDLINTTLTTPYLEHNIQEGAKWIPWYYQVKKEGYKDSEVIFKTESTEDRFVHFELEPLNSATPTDYEKINYQFGAFTVLSDPPGAHVVLKGNGAYIGKTPTEVRYFMVDKNRESAIIIKQFILSRRGFRPTELTLNLVCDYNAKSEALNNPTAVFAMLEPTIEDGSAYSTVKIASEPSGASVYRGGYLLGQTPLEYDFFWKAPSISYELLFEKSGFDSKRAVLRSDDKGIMIMLKPSSETPMQQPDQ